MLNNARGLVPVFTTEAGSCLTAENWQEVNVGIASFYLDSLLLKPGITVLKQTLELKKYLGWSGDLVLNAVNLKINKSGVFSIVSPYDGSKLTCTYFELIELIKHLKPDAVVLPKRVMMDYPELWTNWPDAILPLIYVDDHTPGLLKIPHGVYFHLDNELSINQINQLETLSQIPRYMLGTINPDLMKRLQGMGVEYIESNLPAHHAMQGIVYNSSGQLDLNDNLTEMQFDIIDTHCACPTCSQQFTKAYLHHLLLHTPLLCQRFLIQHNVYWSNRNG